MCIITAKATPAVLSISQALPDRENGNDIERPEGALNVAKQYEPPAPGVGTTGPNSPLDDVGRVSTFEDLNERKFRESAISLAIEDSNRTPFRPTTDHTRL